MTKWIFFFQALFLTIALAGFSSCGQQPKLPVIPGVKGPTFNVKEGKVLITLKLLKANLGQTAKYPVPQSKTSYFEVSPNAKEGGTLLVFHLDVKDLRTIEITQGIPNALPDGRPIPGIPNGTLEDSERHEAELLNLSFYYNSKLFGFYLPLGWDTGGFGGSFPIKLNGKTIGVLGAVASDDQGNGSGMMLFLRLELLEDKEFKELLKISRQNPHFVF